jgi:hypothetical protein
VARYKKTDKGMAQLVVLAFVAAVIGALSVFALFKWMQKPVVEPESASAAPATAQAPTVQAGATPAVQAPLPAAKPTDLETLVAPVALYPDLLLAQLLPASTYPLEVVQAARWLESKPDLAQASGQGWAPSITVLLQFPQVIYMMNDRLSWTAELGDRFLAEPDSVLAAIQSIRARAMTAGLLKDSSEQKVTKAAVTKVSMGNQQGQGVWVEFPAAPKAAQTRQIEVIRIEPANPQVIYVPQYNPQVLYTAPTAGSTSVYDTTTSQASHWLTYGAGVASGALLGWAISEWRDDNWDNNYHGYYRQPYISYYSGNYNGYRGGSDNINIYRNVNIAGNEINVNRKNTLNRPIPIPWVHDPLHRHGYRYTPQAQQRLATPKQQPALAGQRHATGQAVNPDYAGYGRDKLERVQQTPVEKALGQSIASTRKQQDKAVEQKITHSLNQTDKNPGGSPQPVQQRTQERERAFSEVPQNKKTTTESQLAKTHHSTQQAERLSTAKPGKLAKAMPHSAPASDRTVELMSFTGRSSEANSVFSGISEGSQAQTFSKRGQSSRIEGRIGGTGDGRRRK